MHNIGQFVDTAIATSDLKGREEWTELAELAHSLGLHLEYDDRGEDHGTMQDYVVIRQPSTGRWLAHASDLDPELIEATIRNFDSEYEAIQPQIENPEGGYDDGHDESMAARIVDVLLENDVEGFLSDYNRDQERPGGKPIDSKPSGRDVVRTLRFPSGHTLYAWRSDEKREYYGNGPQANYIGYRLVAPNGSIIFDGNDYHPGGGYRGTFTNNDLLSLVQSFVRAIDDMDEEEEAALTPEQREWIESEARQDLEYALGGIEKFPVGVRPPWTDIGGSRRRSRTA